MTETTLFNAKTDAQKTCFIEAYRAHGTVKAGCDAASVPRAVYDLWVATDDEFVRLLKGAYLDYKDDLHVEGRAMARKSPDMMKFYLRGHWPELFGDKSEQKLTMVKKYQEMTDEELENQVRLERSRKV